MKNKHEFVNFQAMIKDLIPYANNARTHSPEQIKQIENSIKEFGFTNPVIVDEKNSIIAGHGRIIAASNLKMTHVPCIKVSGWTDAQKKAYVLADNKLALNAGWDKDLLKFEIESLDKIGFNLSNIGFSVDELDFILNIPSFEPGTDNDQAQLDQLSPKMVNCPHCGKDFDSRGNEK